MRGILSAIRSIYNPLGILSPIVPLAKIRMLELCRQQLRWNDPTPPAPGQEWRNWLKELHQQECFQVAWCLNSHQFGVVTVVQLYHFTDASENGYATVTYVLLHDTHARVHSSFVMGKSRASPLNLISIPCINLTAPALASNLDTFWKRELHMPQKQSQCFGQIVPLCIFRTRPQGFVP